MTTTSHESLLDGLIPDVDAAKELDVTPRTLDRYCKRRDDPFPTIKIGNRRYVDRAAARAWILRQKGSTTVEHRSAEQRRVTLQAQAAAKAKGKRGRGRPRKSELAAAE